MKSSHMNVGSVTDLTTTVDIPETVIAKEAWLKPAITSYAPVTVAEGLSSQTGDGISNLS